ncbi:DMT family transporter [Notoacmeibacter sp. MSK16QG-6]|uniref:DMT family transporter n=1 Tax=Notoacmeibacter sp. MSK16QG-6 TaxID=2957982 RepID=UPI00209D8FDA|nr:DMT family transporter [Notoacmeibacter sp. MSK16QG-6]MCP1199962.1 DMT family transporter [Notoacmeibacter sp. MSK16QG-6]
MRFSAAFVPLLFVVLWSTGFVSARYAMPYAEPFSFLGVRFVLSAAALGLIAAFVKSSRLSWAQKRDAMIAGMLMHGVYLGMVFWAIDNGMPAGLSALIVGLQPLLTAFMAAATLGETITRRQWTGLAVGLVGVTMVLGPRIGQIGSGVNFWTVSAICLAVLTMSAGTVLQKGRLKGASPVASTIWQFVGAVLLTVPVALLLEDQTFTLTTPLVLSMAWLVLVLSVGTILLLMWLIEKGAVSGVAALFYLVPACTAILAYILFGEPLSPIQIAGMAITALAVAMTDGRASRQPPVAPGSA